VPGRGCRTRICAAVADGVEPAGSRGDIGAGRSQPDFTATGPDHFQVADATRIPCGGMFWLTAVRDAFSERVVG